VPSAWIDTAAASGWTATTCGGVFDCHSRGNPDQPSAGGPPRRVGDSSAGPSRCRHVPRPCRSMKPVVMGWDRRPAQALFRCRLLADAAGRIAEAPGLDGPPARRRQAGYHARTGSTDSPKGWGCRPYTWCEPVGNFSRLFHNVAGCPTVVDQVRSLRPHRRYRLLRHTRQSLDAP
jgi:hypothetical protein